MLFCLTANYTHKALDAMRENPNTNRREAVEKMVTAAGGKLVEMYGTDGRGPGCNGDLRRQLRCGRSNHRSCSINRRPSQRQNAASVLRGRSEDYPAKARADPRVLQAARSMEPLYGRLEAEQLRLQRLQARVLTLTQLSILAE